jgi:hypothetical protein
MLDTVGPLSGGQAPQSVLDNASRIPFSDIQNGTAVTIPSADLLKVIPKH